MGLKEDVLELIQAADTANVLADEVLQKQAAIDGEVTKIAPDVAQLLVDGEWVPANQKEAAAEALRDPLKALGILKLALTQQPPTAARTMGTPVSKTASAGGAAPPAARSNPGYIGARSGQPTDADRAMFARLGLAEPTTGGY